jgi:hypothetical protein
MRARRVFTFILFCVALSVPRVGAQVLSLQFGDATPGFEAAVGDTIEVEVRTDLQGFSAAGVALYLSIPDGPFEVVGAPGADRGSQPFRAGPFFGEAVELANSLVPQDLIPDSNRGRLRCTSPLSMDLDSSARKPDQGLSPGSGSCAESRFARR